jgi:hypothetical protein
MHVGSDTTKESNWAIKRTEKAHEVIEHIEKQFQKYFVPGINTAIDESTVWFRGKKFSKFIIQKATKWSIRLLVLAYSDTGFMFTV